MKPPVQAVPRRFGRGWPERELAELLEVLGERPRTFPEASLGELDRAAGWCRRLSRTVVAREPPGPPGPVFRRLVEAVEAYEFSDPAIVRGYFRPDSELLGRRMLLELRTVGFRFLCPVVVSRVRRESDSRRSVVGFRYDTLEGHVENGAEWFLLTKDHTTGRILFTIDARWRSGALPTWWMRLGFPVLAPRSQRLWHRRAHRRLHALARDPAAWPDRGSRRGRLRSGGPRVPFDDRAARRDPGTDRLHGGVGTGTAAAALGALTGIRSTASLYTLARHRAGYQAGLGAGPSGFLLERLLSGPAAVPVLSAALTGEMAADKWPRIPARTAPPALAGRLVIAGAAGWTLARRRRRPPLRLVALAVASAGIAAAGATALRRRGSRKVPGTLLGLGEDALVLAGGEILARRLAGELPMEERDGAGRTVAAGSGGVSPPGSPPPPGARQPAAGP